MTGIKPEKPETELARVIRYLLKREPDCGCGDGGHDVKVLIDDLRKGKHREKKGASNEHS